MKKTLGLVALCALLFSGIFQSANMNISHTVVSASAFIFGDIADGY